MDDDDEEKSKYKLLGCDVKLGIRIYILTNENGIRSQSTFNEIIRIHARVFRITKE